MTTENPFVLHQERLVELMALSRCSLKHTLADFALVLIFPDSEEVDLNQMLETATDTDIDIAYALMKWRKNHSVSQQCVAVGNEILNAMTRDDLVISTVEELFNHYRSMNIVIGETSKKSKNEVERLLSQGASFQRFPSPDEDNFGVFGHYILVEGERYKKRFAVNQNHGNGKLSFGTKF